MCRGGTEQCAAAPISQAEDDGTTPLSAACIYGHAECARLLIHAGAAISQATNSGTTALLVTCAEGHVECARLLLEAGAAVDQALNGGTTPLIIACRFGHLEVVKLLSSYGASRAAMPLGTPEEVANRHGHADLAAWLVASRGWTPLQHLEALTVDRARSLRT